MRTIYNEKNIQPGNVSMHLRINNAPVHVVSNNLCTSVLLKDNRGNPVLTYAMNTFYKDFVGKEIVEYHRDNVQYYNTTEEQSFQYNTIQDYRTHQAMVHIHDAMRKNYACTPDAVLEALQDLLDNPMGDYTISIEKLPETGGSS